MARLILVLPVFWIAALGSPVAAALDGLEAGTTAVVVEVIDGDTLLLDDGTEVRLVGIQAPKLPLGRPDFETQPLAPEAKAAMEALALGRTVRLFYGGRRVDRWNRALAHLESEDGRWLQGEMLRAGLARVYTFRDNRARIPEMLALERAARADGRGIWSHPYFAIRAATETPHFIDSFQLVQGTVVTASIVKKRAYLNFGADWREDFTVTVAPADVRLFLAENVDLESLAGARVRVRGWLKSFNGPQIEATHPEQIEVIAP